MKAELQVSLGGGTMPNYAAALLALGAQPLAAYLPEPAPERCAGLILAGGGDVSPARYGAENSASMYVDEARDAAELRLIRAYAAAGKPILGICRGHQVLNVCFGGSLVQHLPTADTHTPSKNGDAVHTTRAAEGSFLAALYGLRFPVNSAHHQGIGALAPELEAVQWADDGVIEACRHRILPIWSVQWHPERMSFAHARPDTVDGAALLRWFLQQAGALA